MPKKKVQNSFESGLLSDASALVSSKNTYSDAENIEIISKEGDNYILKNIKGNKLKAFIPKNHIPRAIKSYNGIAYIVSSAYDDDGNYVYTEIGTYPSPVWNDILPMQTPIDVNDLKLPDNIVEEDYYICNNNVTSYINNEDIEQVAAIVFPTAKAFDGNINIYYYNFSIFDVKAFYNISTSVHRWEHVNGSEISDSVDVELEGVRGYVVLFDLTNSGFSSIDNNNNLENLYLDVEHVFYKTDDENNIGSEPRPIFGAYNLRLKKVTNEKLRNFVSLWQDAPNPTFKSSVCEQIDSGKDFYYVYFNNDGSNSPINSKIVIYPYGNHTYGRYNGTLWKNNPRLIHKALFTVGDWLTPYSSDLYDEMADSTNTTTYAWLQHYSDTDYGGDGLHREIILKFKSFSGKINFDDIKIYAAGFITLHKDGHASTKELRVIPPYALSDNSPSFGNLCVWQKSYVDNTNSSIHPKELQPIAYKADNQSVLFKCCNGSEPLVLYQKEKLNIEGYTLQACGTNQNQNQNQEITIDVPIQLTEEGYVSTPTNYVIVTDADSSSSTHYDKFGSMLLNNPPGITTNLYFSSDNDKVGLIEVTGIQSDIPDYLELYHFIYNHGNVTAVTNLSKDIIHGNNENAKKYLKTYDNNHVPNGQVNGEHFMRNGYWINSGDISEYIDSIYNNYLVTVFSETAKSHHNLAFWIHTYVSNAKKNYLLANYNIEDNQLSINGIRGTNNQDINDEISILVYDCGSCNPDTDISGFSYRHCIDSGASFDIKTTFSSCDSSVTHVNAAINIYFDAYTTHDFGLGGYYPFEEADYLFSSQYLYTGSFVEHYAWGNYYLGKKTFLFLNIPVNTEIILLTIASSSIANIEQIYAFFTADIGWMISGYYVCRTNCESVINDAYSPIINFTNDVTLSDIELLDESNYNDPFRTKRLVKDDILGLDLLLQPNYDNTINMIISDRGRSKVKLINSRFAFDALNKRFYIPQAYDYNDDNIYCDRNAHRMELIPRFEKPLKVIYEGNFIGGKLKPGKYIIYARYIDADNNKTDICANTLPISVFFKDSNNNSIGMREDEVTNSMIRLKLYNFDRGFKYIELSYAYSSGDVDIIETYYVLNKHITIPIADYTVINITGDENVKELREDEIGIYYNHHVGIHSIGQAKNRLIFAGEELMSNDVYREIKNLAIEKLKIREKLLSTDDPYFYKKEKNTYYATGYWRGETYQLGVELLLKSGGVSPVFFPRGLDNINGSGDYSDTQALIANNSQFLGAFGENGLGIYRTSLNHPIYDKDYVFDSNTQTGTYENKQLYILALYLEGLHDFMNDPIVSRIATGVRVVRKDRMKDAIVQGYISPAFCVPMGVGLKIDTPLRRNDDPSVANYRTDFIDEYENYWTFDNDLLDIQEIGYGVSENAGERQVRYFAAPFSIIQAYYNQVNIDFGDGTHLYKGLVVKPDSADLLKIKVINIRIKPREGENHAAFISADFNADAPYFAANMRGKNIYYYISDRTTEWHFGDDAHEYSNTEDGTVSKKVDLSEDNIYKFVIAQVSSGVKNHFSILSDSTYSYFIQEGQEFAGDKFFSTKLDANTLSFNLTSYVGITEEPQDNDSNIVERLRSYGGHDAYGILSNVYKNKGPIDNETWKKIYANEKNIEGFYPITEVLPIGTDLSSFLSSLNESYLDGTLLESTMTQQIGCNNEGLYLFNGDCYITPTMIRTIYKVGIVDDTNNEENVWDYVGSVQAQQYTGKDFIKSKDPKKNSFFADGTYVYLQRQRLVNKAFWVEVVHESNYNLGLRSYEKPLTAEENARWQSVRHFMPSINDQNNYFLSHYGSYQLESHSYNKGYSYAKGAILNFSFKDLEKLIDRYNNTVEISDIAIEGALQNGYRKFYGLNRKNYVTDYGPITKVETFNDLAYVIHEHGVGVLPLAEKYMTSGEMGGIFVNQETALGDDLFMISNKYGSINKNSIISTSMGIFMYDFYNNAIYNIAGKSIKDISALKIDTFLNQFKNTYVNFGDQYIFDVIANVDELNHLIYYSFVIISKTRDYQTVCFDSDDINNGIIGNTQDDDGFSGEGDNTSNGSGEIDANYALSDDDGFSGEINVDEEHPLYIRPYPTAQHIYEFRYKMTLVYNMMTGKWRSRTTFYPAFIWNGLDASYSTNNEYNVNRIYKEFDNSVNRCFIYDKQHPFSIEFNVNDLTIVQKIYDNIAIIQNETTPISLRYSLEDQRDIDDLTRYNLTTYQNVKRRRHEVKIIGAITASTNVNDMYLNVLNPEQYGYNVGYTFNIGPIQYRIDSITNTETESGVELPKVVISYFDGFTWIPLNTFDTFGLTVRNNLYGHVLGIISYPITAYNTEFVEDILYITVETIYNREEKLRDRQVRGKYFKVRIDYDGVDETYIQGVISSLTISKN